MLKKILSILLLTLLFSFQTKPNVKNQLLGTWTFEKFDFPNYIPADSDEAKEANKANKGLQITFTADNKFISKQPNGRRENNIKTTYKIPKDNIHLVIGSDTNEIEKIDETTLILFVEGRPTITFKKNK